MIITNKFERSKKKKSYALENHILFLIYLFYPYIFIYISTLPVKTKKPILEKVVDIADTVDLHFSITSCVSSTDTDGSLRAFLTIGKLSLSLKEINEYLFFFFFSLFDGFFFLLFVSLYK